MVELEHDVKPVYEMMEKTWNDTYLGDENAVNVQISRLRTTIEDNTRDPGAVWKIKMYCNRCICNCLRRERMSPKHNRTKIWQALIFA